MKTLDLTSKNDSALSVSIWLRIAANILVAIIISILFGRTMAPYFSGLPKAQAGWYMLALVGTGWIVQLFMVYIFARRKYGVYFYRLTRLMVFGVLILIPVITAHLFFAHVWCLYHTISVGISLIAMLFLHYKIINDLSMRQVFTFSWFMSLTLTSGTGLYLLNLNFPIL